jgi:uncharacterized membrane protein YtjA (UPF0391 family)
MVVIHFLRTTGKFSGLSRLSENFSRASAGKFRLESLAYFLVLPSSGRLCGITAARQRTKEGFMLNWAVTFLVIALIAGVLGFTGIAGAASQIAWILFVVFIVLFLVSLIAGRGRGPLV